MEQFFRFTWGRADLVGRICFAASIGLLSSLALGVLALVLFIPVVAAITLAVIGTFGAAAAIMFLLDRIDDFKTYKRLRNR